MHHIDLTQTFTNHMPVYPGDPEAVIEQVANIPEHSYTDHRLCTNMHVGTHIDAPLHMIENGEIIADIPLDRCIGKGILLDARGKERIDTSVIPSHIPERSIVLLYTDYGSKYRTDAYFKGYPELDPAFSEEMVKAKVMIVGMDMIGPDYDSPWRNHKILLGNGVYILENLTNLDQLLGIESFEVIALPMKITTDAAPVRVIARY